MIVLMIGLPGSGKSYLAKRLVADHLKQPFTQAAIVSADDFFTDDDGSYQHIASAIGNAHMSCKSRLQEFAKKFKDSDLIVVDNTNLIRKDRDNYLEAVADSGHTVAMIYVRCPIETCIARNVHQVPEQYIRDHALMIQEPEPGPNYHVIDNP